MILMSLITKSGSISKKETEFKKINISVYSQKQRRSTHIRPTSSSIALKFATNFSSSQAYSREIDDYKYPKFMKHNLFSDIFNPSFKLEPKNVCGKDTEIIILINSRSDNFQNRQHFRSQHLEYNDTHTAIVFLSSINPGNSKSEFELRKEAKIYQDIVITPYKDSYETLSEKIANGFLWVIRQCWQSRIILKVDDDVFINYRILNQTLYQNFGNFTIFGQLCTSCIPYSPGGINKEISNVKSDRLVVTRRHFPSSKYPFFMYGTSYGLSTDIVPLLFLASMDADYFAYEDVFWTGILPKIFSENYSAKKLSEIFEDFSISSTYFRSNQIGNFLLEMKNKFLKIISKRVLEKKVFINLKDVPMWRISTHKCFGKGGDKEQCKKYLTIHHIDWKEHYEYFRTIL